MESLALSYIPKVVVKKPAPLFETIAYTKQGRFAKENSIFTGGLYKKAWEEASRNERILWEWIIKC